MTKLLPFGVNFMAIEQIKIRYNQLEELLRILKNVFTIPRNLR
ncbi:hypothetical protein HME9304_03165 [Flagellimonas maritima]|uniref:Uncharacterized protein n=1 Tax=Flagellimonas maritima TaxID=1383885 RepID=A0A2Z4LWR0_9FLAO|nr:hypothetical protein HME9304_03165 [Allomuricauda aurantiaca]